ncbi:hypothetical protein FNF27_06544 [Cafeteria roenbergensis]|uniref:Uncharacterized protein n=1 Tax=Cafeteria roenbergensis TaxID=33653 RepID=A0A5A8DYV8_CAFRO|nr:hypothetical protein FNF27_06544 [Cafeteria roenbergensis]
MWCCAAKPEPRQAIPGQATGRSDPGEDNPAADGAASAGLSLGPTVMGSAKSMPRVPSFKAAEARPKHMSMSELRFAVEMALRALAAFLDAFAANAPPDPWSGKYPEELLDLFRTSKRPAKGRKEPRKSLPPSLETPAAHASPRQPVFEPAVRAAQAVASLSGTPLLTLNQSRAPFDPEFAAWLAAKSWPSFLGQSVAFQARKAAMSHAVARGMALRRAAVAGAVVLSEVAGERVLAAIVEAFRALTRCRVGAAHLRISGPQTVARGILRDSRTAVLEKTVSILAHSVFGHSPADVTGNHPDLTSQQDAGQAGTRGVPADATRPMLTAPPTGLGSTTQTPLAPAAPPIESTRFEHGSRSRRNVDDLAAATGMSRTDLVSGSGVEHGSGTRSSSADARAKRADLGASRERRLSSPTGLLVITGTDNDDFGFDGDDDDDDDAATSTSEASSAGSQQGLRRNPESVEDLTRPRRCKC